MAKGPIKHTIHERNFHADERQKAANHRLDHQQLRREFDRAPILVLAALGASRWTFFFFVLVAHWLVAFLLLGLFDELFDHHRIGGALFGADEREREKGDPGHCFAVERTEETVEAVGLLACFGDDGFIASEHDRVVFVEQMMTNEEPV